MNLFDVYPLFDINIVKGKDPEGVCFAILLMNLTVPLLEYLTRPRVYGLKSLLFGIRPVEN